ncbi:SMI1/KNR4 family protein [Pararhizobium sp.]|uniref:SMI1/KNR4 family protein n=1 Tax=Pararhizobium sp. TaxID=1977563 RepID=UPI00271BB2C4|nr:SMI1/KNR4 family protein [Pararhizobium sp.]MDO9417157.1 SMI1/KNR4 family protein [Pararhizobium sp.]
MDFGSLAELIDLNRDKAVEFGSGNCDLNPTATRVQETEDRVRAKLPPSYLWFVNNYGGGEIYGEEIFSIYRVFRPESAGDIAVNTCRFRESGFISATEIALCANDFGEIFTLDVSVSSDDGEYAVYVRRGQYRVAYAENFAEFLAKRIQNQES